MGVLCVCVCVCVCCVCVCVCVCECVYICVCACGVYAVVADAIAMNIANTTDKYRKSERRIFPYRPAVLPNAECSPPHRDSNDVRAVAR